MPASNPVHRCAAARNMATLAAVNEPRMALAAPTEPIRVAIVDDHELVRSGLRNYLNSEVGFEVVGMARDGIEALALVQRTHVDVLTLDLHMPRMDGVQVLEQLCTVAPHVQVVVWTAAAPSEYPAVRRFPCVRHHLQKNCDPGEVARAIRDAAARNDGARPPSP